MGEARLWNSNIHYHPLLVNAIPKGADKVLDVGCGDGVLSAHLVQAGVRQVVALDLDAGVLARARARHPGLPIDWIHGDIFDLSLRDQPFDAVVSVAALHHMDAAAGLIRFAELVMPGGLVGVVGLAANDWYDWPHAAVGHCARLAAGILRGYWEHSALMAWPPPATYREMKQIARDVLPGVRYRRLLYGRYSLVWTRPRAL
jgi:SAM-dependent methyltransferase